MCPCTGHTLLLQVVMSRHVLQMLARLPSLRSLDLNQDHPGFFGHYHLHPAGPLQKAGITDFLVGC